MAALVKKNVCKSQSIGYTEVLLGRILHVRIPGDKFSLDVISVYQFVWRSNTTSKANEAQRQVLLDKFGKHLKNLPHRNTLISAAYSKSSLLPDKSHTCVLRGPRLQIKSVRPLRKLSEEHGLRALNTWSAGKPVTQGNSVSQIDFVLARLSQARGPVSPAEVRRYVQRERENRKLSFRTMRGTDNASAKRTRNNLFFVLLTL